MAAYIAEHNAVLLTAFTTSHIVMNVYCVYLAFRDSTVYFVAICTHTISFRPGVLNLFLKSEGHLSGLVTSHGPEWTMGFYCPPPSNNKFKWALTVLSPL